MIKKAIKKYLTKIINEVLVEKLTAVNVTERADAIDEHFSKMRYGSEKTTWCPPSILDRDRLKIRVKMR